MKDEEILNLDLAPVPWTKKFISWLISQVLSRGLLCSFYKITFIVYFNRLIV